MTNKKTAKYWVLPDDAAQRINKWLGMQPHDICMEVVADFRKNLQEMPEETVKQFELDTQKKEKNNA